MSSTLTILGMYNYDATIFDDMVLPENVDRDTLVRNIISELAEVEVLYSDPDYLKYAITNWSYKEIAVWNRLAESFELEYNPLYNVDATEYTKETRDLKATEVGSNTGSTTANDTSTHKVAGFNDSSLTNAEQDTSDGSSSSTANSNINKTDKGDIITEHRRYGNIGVTKSTELMKSELDIRPQLNIYNFIIESFKNRFCLLIY